MTGCLSKRYEARKSVWNKIIQLPTLNVQSKRVAINILIPDTLIPSCYRRPNSEDRINRKPDDRKNDRKALYHKSNYYIMIYWENYLVLCCLIFGLTVFIYSVIRFQSNVPVSLILEASANWTFTILIFLCPCELNTGQVESKQYPICSVLELLQKTDRYSDIKNAVLGAFMALQFEYQRFVTFQNLNIWLVQCSYSDRTFCTSNKSICYWVRPPWPLRYQLRGRQTRSTISNELQEVTK